MSDKSEATRWADALMDGDYSNATELAALLRRWPDGEPNLQMYKDAIKQVRGLHERIAALEAQVAAEAKAFDAAETRIVELESALEQARVALDEAKPWLATVSQAMATGAYENVMSALRAIEEAQR